MNFSNPFFSEPMFLMERLIWKSEDQKDTISVKTFVHIHRQKIFFIKQKMYKPENFSERFEDLRQFIEPHPDWEETFLLARLSLGLMWSGGSLTSVT